MLLAVIPIDTFSVVVTAIGIVSLFVLAWDHRARLELRAHLAELLSVAVARGRPLPGLFAAISGDAGWRIARTADTIRDALESGASLADALDAVGRRAFPRDFVESVRATEGTPALADVMADLAHADLARLARHHRLCVTLLYPLLLVGGAVALGGLVNRIAEANPFVVLDEGTHAFQQFLLWVVLAPVGLLVLWNTARTNAWIGRGAWTSRIDALRTAGRLLAHALPLPDALSRAASAADNRRTSRRFAYAAERIAGGDAPIAILPTIGLSPAEVARAERADPDELARILLASATRLDDRAARRTGRWLRLAQPAAILVAAALVFVEFRTLIHVFDASRQAVQLW